MRHRVSAQLPDFCWDTLAAAKARAQAHDDGIVDLSVGTPVDPSPQLVSDALASAAGNWAGYPTVWGTPQLRAAIINYLTGRWAAHELAGENVLPAVGSKEFVANLPCQLGLDANDIVVIPTTAYPTYEVGALLAGAQVQRCDDPAQVSGRVSLIWINYPANPHGAIAGDDLLRGWVELARRNDAVLASDECYGEFGWDSQPVSILNPRINDGDLTNLLGVFSLSKRSNLAGYRAGFVAGDSQLVTELLQVRKHAGFMVPGPVQEAMIVALNDQEHVAVQRERYRARRAKLRTALESAGFHIEHSQGSLYLWATRDEDGRASVAWLAQRGILVAPGDFYGPASGRFIRVALTATDERIDAAVARLS